MLNCWRVIRVAAYCIDGTNGGYKSSTNRDSETHAQKMFGYLIRGSLLDVWMLPAEITLYRAELAAKGVLAGDALYRLGVTQT